MTEKQTRDEWKGRFGFVLSTIGAAIGLGNIWRFPYSAYENGGGAFLFPYLVALLTVGVPMMILEVAMGVYFQSSSTKIFSRISKKFAWVGLWQTAIPLIVMSFYGVVISWSLSFLFFSLRLAWGENPGDFFANEFLQISNSLGEFGSFRWNVFFWPHFNMAYKLSH